MQCTSSACSPAIGYVPIGSDRRSAWAAQIALWWRRLRAWFSSPRVPDQQSVSQPWDSQLARDLSASTLKDIGAPDWVVDQVAEQARQRSQPLGLSAGERYLGSL